MWFEADMDAILVTSALKIGIFWKIHSSTHSIQ